MSRSTKLEVTATIHGDDGEDLDVLVTCSLSPGEKAYGPRGDDPGYPGSNPEIEIESIATDDGESRDVSFLIPSLSKDDLERITEKAVEDAGERDAGAYEDAMEARAEARREAALDR